MFGYDGVCKLWNVGMLSKIPILYQFSGNVHTKYGRPQNVIVGIRRDDSCVQGRVPPTAWYVDGTQGIPYLSHVGCHAFLKMYIVIIYYVHILCLHVFLALSILDTYIKCVSLNCRCYGCDLFHRLYFMIAKMSNTKKKFGSYSYSSKQSFPGSCILRFWGHVTFLWVVKNYKTEHL